MVTIREAQNYLANAIRSKDGENEDREVTRHYYERAYEAFKALADSTKDRVLLDKAEKIKNELNNFQEESDSESDDEPIENDDMQQLRSIIQNAKVDMKNPDHKITWDDVIGAKKAKEELEQAVINPVKYKFIYRRSGGHKPKRGVLLYGPPGTGKTQLARAVASESDATFYSVTSSDLLGKYVGESEKTVKLLFNEVQRNRPAVVFIDEIDALMTKRGEGDGNEGMQRVKNEFLTKMDGVGSNMDGVFILGATNLPWTLDDAFMRRFPSRIYIELPGENDRADLFNYELGKIPHVVTRKEMEALAAQTYGLSGSDIRNVVDNAATLVLAKADKAVQVLQIPGGYYLPVLDSPNCPKCPKRAKPISDDESIWDDCPYCGALGVLYKACPADIVEGAPVRLEELIEALNDYIPSVNKKSIQKYEDFRRGKT